MSPEPSASDLITNYIASLTDWRSDLLARLRELILEAAPEITEEWKWDTPVWSQKGNVVAAGVFKGAALNDPAGLFNAGLEAKAMRAIDFRQDDKIQETALQNLVRSAVAINLSGGKKK